MYCSMKHKPEQNYLKAFRLKSGLSQRELGALLGYANGNQVSQHERATAGLPLRAAISYELVLRKPVSMLFPGIRDVIELEVEERLRQLEMSLGHRDGKDRDAKLTAHKLMWLNERRKHAGS
jgi:transcriptional regulator with XRE-family HTH domain